MTVRPGVPVFTRVKMSPAWTVEMIDRFGAVERDDVRGRGRVGVAEDQHVGESLPGLGGVRAIATPPNGWPPWVLNAASSSSVLLVGALVAAVGRPPCCPVM